MNIDYIKTIDVKHASLAPDGELVDNFAIVDFLLKHIEELEFFKAYVIQNNEAGSIHIP